MQTASKPGWFQEHKGVRWLATSTPSLIAKQRASASEAKIMIASYSRFWYIYIYMCPHLTQASATVVQAWYCYSCASLISAPCAEWYIALQPRSMLFSGFLCSVAFLPQAFRSQSIDFHRSRRAPSPTLRRCNVQWPSVERPYHLQTLGALHLYKCWITLCWCTKYPSKNKLPLPLLARKRDNRQSDGETIGKAAMRQSWHIMPFCIYGTWHGKLKFFRRQPHR